MSIRSLKNRSRLALHNAMAVPAVYVDPATQQQIACTVRVHTRVRAFGDMQGLDFSPVERTTEVPEIVALASEVSPSRGGVFSLTADEAYEVETVMPPDGITISAQVTRMRQSEIDDAQLPVPGGA